MTPHVVLEVNGGSYVVAHCPQDRFEIILRLDRIRGSWLP